VAADTSGDAASDAATDRTDSGSATDAPADVAATCMTFCDTMQATCSSYSGYPWANLGACVSACNMFTAAEFKCWNYFANLAKNSAVDRQHNCEHARGDDGLMECPP